MARLKERNIHSVLLTNSLRSTDAFYVAAYFSPRVSFYQNISNSEMFVYRGDAQAGYPGLRYTNGRKLTAHSLWGIHSKSFVFGEEDFAVGTFNLDPRSADLNSENLVFCEGNRDLARYVAEDMKNRIASSDLLDHNGKLPGGKTMGETVGFVKRWKFRLSKPIARWFASLL
jgi:putative cardiolipin synthase